jgi:hypothetical protein
MNVQPKVPMADETMKKCQCAKCPTYMENDLRGGVFCSTGKVGNPRREGCYCFGCPVHRKYLLRGSYFCILGAAVD